LAGKLGLEVSTLACPGDEQGSVLTMETRANYTLIGAFALAVIAGAFLFVFWFAGGGNKQSGRDSYRIVFSSSVSGLTRGSQVLFNGLKVGEVTTIDLAPDPSEVYAMIEVDGRTPVKTDTRARLEYQGLTGISSIALTGGTADAKAPRMRSGWRRTPRAWRKSAPSALTSRTSSRRCRTSPARSTGC
jgi:ABC-type transporter Mla subunit MlaD